MREKIEKWLDGYIAVMEAYTSYPNLDDEGISLCFGSNYIHLHRGFDTVAEVLGLDVTIEERIDAFKQRYIHKRAKYKGYEICTVKKAQE